MARADHIKVYRKAYYHHGIDLGDGYVIHYTGEVGSKQNAEIKKDKLTTFLKKGKLEIVKYDQCSCADSVIKRAQDSIGEKQYSLLFNNCEHFARYCKTGKKESEQVKDATATAVAAVGTGVAATGAIAGVSAAGSAAGLSAAGVMSGLAAIGPGGVVGGIATLAAAPAVITNIAVSKILKDDRHFCKKERKARKAGRVAAKVGTAGGVVGTVGTISAVGTTAGLSAAGITSGLAAIGGSVGGGMVAGVAISVAAPAVVAGAIGFGVYKAWKLFSK